VGVRDSRPLGSGMVSSAFFFCRRKKYCDNGGMAFAHHPALGSGMDSSASDRDGEVKDPARLRARRGALFLVAAEQVQARDQRSPPSKWRGPGRQTSTRSAVPQPSERVR
jgi:hypothetical protein